MLLSAELLLGIPRYVDLASELFLDPTQARKELSNADCTDNQQIDVALRMLFALRDRTVDSRPLYLGPESTELGLKQR